MEDKKTDISSDNTLNLKKQKLSNIDERNSANNKNNKNKKIIHKYKRKTNIKTVHNFPTIPFNTT